MAIFNAHGGTSVLAIMADNYIIQPYMFNIYCANGMSPQTMWNISRFWRHEGKPVNAMRSLSSPVE
jgi:hypothetical protein